MCGRVMTLCQRAGLSVPGAVIVNLINQLYLRINKQGLFDRLHCLPASKCIAVTTC